MNIHRTEVGETLVLELDGELDSQTSPELEARCRHEQQQGSSHFVLDLGRLKRVSGPGLRVLLGLARGLPRSGGSLVLCALEQKVAEALEVSDLKRWFEIAPNRKAALAKSRRLRSPAGARPGERPRRRAARAEVEEILQLATDLLTSGDREPGDS